MVFVFFFFFKQKTAYEMRISDWSSDVCSSDLKGAWTMSKYESRTERWRPRSPTLQEVEKSLDRYPDLGEQELAALIRQFRSLSVVDNAVIMGDVRLSRKLAVFSRHHEPDLQAPVAGLVLYITLPAALAFAGVRRLGRASGRERDCQGGGELGGGRV